MRKFDEYDLVNRFFSFRSTSIRKSGTKYDVHSTEKHIFQGLLKTSSDRMERLIKAGRIVRSGKSIAYKRKANDVGMKPINNLWLDTGGASNKIYVVQSAVASNDVC